MQRITKQNPYYRRPYLTSEHHFYTPITPQPIGRKSKLQLLSLVIRLHLIYKIALIYLQTYSTTTDEVNNIYEETDTSTQLNLSYQSDIKIAESKKTT